MVAVLVVDRCRLFFFSTFVIMWVCILDVLTRLTDIMLFHISCVIDIILIFDTLSIVTKYNISIFIWWRENLMKLRKRWVKGSSIRSVRAHHLGLKTRNQHKMFHG